MKGINRRSFIKGSTALVGSIASASSLGALLKAPTNLRLAGSSPLSLPLVTANTPLFTYLGKFNGPPATNNDQAFQYGAGAMSVAGSTSSSLGNLYANGLQQGTANLGLMSIPSPKGSNGTYTGNETATMLVSPKQSPISNFAGNDVSTGSLAYNNKLYVTGAHTYDADGSQTKFLIPMNTDMTGQGEPCSANGNAGSINRMFSNSMGLVPSIWQSLLGGPAFIAGGPGGMGGLSIISQQCCGYGFSTFNPDAVVSGQPVAINEWINWPYDTEGTGNSNHVSKLWTAGVFNKSNWTGGSANPGNNYVSIYDRPIGCAFIPDGSRSLCFIHWHAYGPHTNKPDTGACGGGESGSSGASEAPVSPDTQAYIRMQVVAFDLAEVIASRNAGHPVTAVLPYAWWEFPNWATYTGQPNECSFGDSWPSNAWAAYDPVARADGTHRMYWNKGFHGTNGTVFAFSVGKIG